LNLKRLNKVLKMVNNKKIFTLLALVLLPVILFFLKLFLYDYLPFMISLNVIITSIVIMGILVGILWKYKKNIIEITKGIDVDKMKIILISFLIIFVLSSGLDAITLTISDYVLELSLFPILLSIIGLFGLFYFNIKKDETGSKFNIETATNFILFVFVIPFFFLYFFDMILNFWYVLISDINTFQNTLSYNEFMATTFFPYYGISFHNILVMILSLQFFDKIKLKSMSILYLVFGFIMFLSYNIVNCISVQGVCKFYNDDTVGLIINFIRLDLGQQILYFVSIMTITYIVYYLFKKRGNKL